MEREGGKAGSMRDRVPRRLSDEEARGGGLLVREVFVAADRYRLGVARRVGLSVTELAALGHLEQGGGITPTELGERLGLTSAGVTGLIDRLVRAGCATRQPHPVDRRSVIVCPTPRAGRVLRKVYESLATDFGTALGQVASGDRQAVTDFMHALVEELKPPARRGGRRAAPGQNDCGVDRCPDDVAVTTRR